MTRFDFRVTVTGKLFTTSHTVTCLCRQGTAIFRRFTVTRGEYSHPRTRLTAFEMELSTKPSAKAPLQHRRVDLSLYAQTGDGDFVLLICKSCVINYYFILGGRCTKESHCSHRQGIHHTGLLTRKYSQVNCKKKVKLATWYSGIRQTAHRTL